MVYQTREMSRRRASERDGEEKGKCKGRGVNSAVYTPTNVYTTERDEWM